MSRKSFIHDQNTTIIGALSIIIDRFENTNLSDIIDSNLTPKVSLANIFTASRAILTAPWIVPFSAMMLNKEKREEFFAREDTWEMLISKGKTLSKFLATNKEILGDILANQLNSGITDSIAKEERKAVIKENLIPLLENLSNTNLDNENRKKLSNFLASIMQAQQENNPTKLLDIISEISNNNYLREFILSGNNITHFSKIVQLVNVSKEFKVKYGIQNDSVKNLQPVIKSVLDTTFSRKDVRDNLIDLGKSIISPGNLEYNDRLHETLEKTRVLAHNFLAESPILSPRNIEIISNVSGPIINKVLKDQSFVALLEKLGETNKVLQDILTTVAEDPKTIDRAIDLTRAILTKSTPAKEITTLSYLDDVFARSQDIAASSAFQNNIAGKPERVKEFSDLVSNLTLPHIELPGENSKLKLYGPLSKTLNGAFCNPETLELVRNIINEESKNKKIHNGISLLKTLKDTDDSLVIKNLAKDQDFMDFVAQSSADNIKQAVGPAIYSFLGLKDGKNLGANILRANEFITNHEGTVLSLYGDQNTETGSNKSRSNSLKSVKSETQNKLVKDQIRDINSDLRRMDESTELEARTGSTYFQKFRNIFSSIKYKPKEKVKEQTERVTKGLNALNEVAKEGEKETGRTAFRDLGRYFSSSAKALGLYALGRNEEAKSYKASAKLSLHHVWHRTKTKNSDQSQHRSTSHKKPKRTSWVNLAKSETTIPKPQTRAGQ